MSIEKAQPSASGGGASAKSSGASAEGGANRGTVERARDRSRTMDRIVHAVGEVLSRDGFQQIGINAVARQAGIDKVLIYRYFGGMAGLMEAYAREVNFWPMTEELAGYDEDRMKKLPLRQQIVEMMKNLARSLHRRPVTQQVIAWELVERNEVTAVLQTARWEVMRDFVRRYVSEENQRANPRLVGAINFIASAVMLLVARGQKGTIFEISDLNDEAAWRELDAAIEHSVSGLIEGGQPES